MDRDFINMLINWRILLDINDTFSNFYIKTVIIPFMCPPPHLLLTLKKNKIRYLYIRGELYNFANVYKTNINKMKTLKRNRLFMLTLFDSRVLVKQRDVFNSFN